MDILLVGDEVLQLLDMSPQHLLDRRRWWRSGGKVNRPWAAWGAQLYDSISFWWSSFCSYQGFAQPLLQIQRHLESEALGRWNCKSYSFEDYLKTDAITRPAKTRRCFPKHFDFMRRHVKLLEEMGYI
jgi:hypothetical protein